MRRRHLLSGEPIVMDMNLVNYWVCCDCHLKHLVLLADKGRGRVEVRMFRDQFGTQEERRRGKGKKK